MEVLKQPQYNPLCIAQMAFIWYAVNEGYLDTVEIKKVVGFAKALQSYLQHHAAALLDEINAKPAYSDELAQKMKKTLDAFVNTAAY